MLQNETLYERAVNVLEEIFKMNNSQLPDGAVFTVDVNEPERIRIRAGNLMLYAYDFQVGENTKERYTRALERTVRLMELNNPNLEVYLTSGTVAEKKDIDKDIIGWYLTHVS